MENPSFICDDFSCSKIIDAEEKLLLVKFLKKNSHSFRMKAQISIFRKSSTKLSQPGI